MEHTTSLRRWIPFGAAAYALVVMLAGANVPTALYSSYEQRFDYPPLVTTLAFSVYAVVLLPSLIVLGPLSDVVGRRRVVVPAIGLAIVAAAVLALASGPGWILLGRALQGLSLGAVQGAATAALADTDPDGDRSRAALAGSLAVVVGSGLGPLLGGVLAQYGPAPLVLAFVVEIALLVVSLVAAVLVLPSAPAAPTVRWRPRRPSVPASIRASFVPAAVTAFLAWAVTALFLALMPSFVLSVTGTTNLALAGGVVTLLFVFAGAAQLVVRRMRSGTAQLFGLGLLVLGLAGVVVAARTGSAAAVLVATALAGSGQGLAFAGSLADVTRAAPPERRADVVSSYYVAIYVGVALPVIGVGVLTLLTGLLAAVQVFALVVALASLAAMVGLIRRAGAAGRGSDDVRSDAVR